MVSHSLVQSIFTFFRKRVAEIHLSTREIQPNNELPTAVECFLNLIGQPTSKDKVNFPPAVTNSNWPTNNGSVSEWKNYSVQRRPVEGGVTLIISAFSVLANLSKYD